MSFFDDLERRSSETTATCHEFDVVALQAGTPPDHSEAPFQLHLLAQNLPMCSPALSKWLENPSSVKSHVSPQEGEEFCWSIDQMANLLPADIDENAIHNIDPDAHVSAWTPRRRMLWQRRNRQMQVDIENFFDPTNKIAPSPWIHQRKPAATPSLARPQSPTWSPPWSPPQPNTASPSCLRAPAALVAGPDCSADTWSSPSLLDGNALDGSTADGSTATDSLDCSTASTSSLRRRLFERAQEVAAETESEEHPKLVFSPALAPIRLKLAPPPRTAFGTLNFDLSPIRFKS